MATRAKFEKPGEYTDKDREKIDPEDFAGPHKSFPVITQSDVHDAAKLIGHADNPEAVKSKIKAIAKKKGFSIPDAWKKEGDRDDMPEETRFTPTVEKVGYAAITRIDEDKREVTLTATSESIDSYKTVFDYSASKDAFNRWIGNVREMHQPIAVGQRVGVVFDDEHKKIDVTLRISKGAQDTWEKIKDGTLKGGSIGASNVQWEKKIARNANEPTAIARKYDLVELSLVDNPSNPDCNILAIRAAMPDMEMLDDMTVKKEEEKAIRGKVDMASLPAAIAALYTDNPEQQIVERTQSVDEPIAPKAKKSSTETTAAIKAAREKEYNYKLSKTRYIEEAGTDALRAVAMPEMKRGDDPTKYIYKEKEIRSSAEAKAMVEWNRMEEEAKDAIKRGVMLLPAGAQLIIPEAPVVDETPRAEIVEAMVDQVADDTAQSIVDSITNILMGNHRHADGTVHGHAHVTPDHDHVTRMGSIIDAKLLDPQYRTFFGGTSMGILATDDPKSLKPMNGEQAITSPKGEPTSMVSVTPQNVGHPVMYNTQDALALGFGVPAPAEKVLPTPTGDVTLNPKDFHSGGHETFAMKRTPEMFDKDGDHDGNEDEKEMKQGPDRILPHSPEPTKVDYAGAEKTPRSVESEEQRAGARLSAKDMESLHKMRDGAMDTAKGLMGHCNCEECRGKSDKMNGTIDGHDADERVMIAKVHRQNQDLSQRLDDMMSIVKTYQTHFDNMHKPYFAELLSAVMQRFDDIQFQQVADSTRMKSADSSRAMIAEVSRVIEPIIQQMTGVASLVEGVKAEVERIAKTPVTSNMPMAYAAEKRVGGMPMSQNPTYQPDAMDNLENTLRNASPQTQVLIASRMLELQESQKLSGRTS